MEDLERLFHASLNKHVREFEALKAKDSSMAAELAALREAQGEFRDWQNSTRARPADGLDSFRATFESRMALHSERITETLSRVDHVSSRVAAIEGSSMRNRFEQLEAAVAESSEKCSKALDAALEKLDHLSRRISSCEENGALLVGKIEDGLAGERMTVGAQVLSLQARVDVLEPRLDELVGRNAKAMAGTQDKVEHLHQRVVACEKALPSQGELHKAQANLSGERAAAEERHALMVRRLDHVERKLASTADAEAVVALQVACDGLATSQDRLRRAQEQLTQGRAVVEDQQLQHLRRHLDAVERLAGRASEEAAHAAGERAGTLCEDLRQALSTLSTEKAALEGQQLILKERLDYLERVTSKAQDKQATESAMAKQDQLSRALASFTQDKLRLEAGTAFVRQRLDELLAMLGEGGGVAALQRSCEELALQCEELGGRQGTLGEAQAKLQGQQLQFLQRVAYLEGMVGSTESQEQAGTEKHSETILKRLRRLEAAVRDHPQSQPEVASSARTSGRCVGFVLQEDPASADEREALEATLNERVGDLEQLLSHLPEKQIKRLETAQAKLEQAQASLVNANKELSAQQGALGERVEQLASRISDTADRDSLGIAAAQKRLDSVHERLLACERQSGAAVRAESLARTLKSETVALSARQDSLREHMQHLECTLSCAVDRHAQDLECLKAGNSRHSRELEHLRESHDLQVMSAERLEYLEELWASRARLGQPRARSALVEELGSAPLVHRRNRSPMRHAGESHAPAGLDFRVDALEQRLQDISRGSGYASEARVAQLRRAASQDALYRPGGSSPVPQAAGDTFPSDEQSSASLQERVRSLERLLCISPRRHGAPEMPTTPPPHPVRPREGLTPEKLARESSSHSVQDRLSYFEGLLGAPRRRVASTGLLHSVTVRPTVAAPRSALVRAGSRPPPPP